MIDPALLELLPPLRRARGDRLYGADEKHWVDLWKQDGTWLLGRRPDGAAKEWKIQLDKGLTGWAPSLWPRRLERLIPRLLPGVQAVRVFRNPERAAAVVGGTEALRRIRWRPWDDRPLPQAPVLCPVLPTGPSQAVALAFFGQETPWPPHDVLSPADAAGLVQAVAQVLRFTADAASQAARAQAGRLFDSHLGTFGVFRRSGIWFEATIPQDRYPSLFEAHLGAGFLLNPDSGAPGVLPWTLSAGEWSRWKLTVDEWTKEGR